MFAQHDVIEGRRSPGAVQHGRETGGGCKELLDADRGNMEGRRPKERSRSQESERDGDGPTEG